MGYIFAPIVGECKWPVKAAYVAIMLGLIAAGLLFTKLAWWIVVPTVLFVGPLVLWLPFTPFVNRTEPRSPINAILITANKDQIFHLKYGGDK